MLCQYYYLSQNSMWLALLQTKACGIDLVNRKNLIGRTLSYYPIDYAAVYQCKVAGGDRSLVDSSSLDKDEDLE